MNLAAMPETTERMPSQIPYIIGNEACERFSFYGMRNILTGFLISTLLLRYVPDKAARTLAAKDVFHTFVIGVYFYPLLGGWISDRLFGKYNTILWFSLVYCVGQGFLAAFADNRDLFYVGLFLIALGSGGIKPLVASFVGDQFDQTNKHRAKLVFDIFYWSINFGSFFASLLMPLILRGSGPRVAFGVPGVLMLVATIVFWAGRGRYVRVAPPPHDPHSFLRVVWTALTERTPEGRAGLHVAVLGLVLGLGAVGLAFTSWLELVPAICLGLVLVLGFGGGGTWMQLDRARGIHPDAAVDGVRSVLRVLVVFALVTPFWSLFDQKASTWVIQGDQMLRPSWFDASQMQLVNPALVMILIPINNLWLFPLLARRGHNVTALGKMTVGMALAGASWIVAGALQLRLDAHFEVSIFWQIVPYILLTLGEVLVSATGLEFAYSQAPLAMKGVIMSFWSLAVTIGNLWVLLADVSVKNPSVTRAIADVGIGKIAFQMFFFALFAFAAAAAFRAYAKRYRAVDNYRTS